MSPVFGEEVWLKTAQDKTCRLYGCPNTGTTGLNLKDATLNLPPRSFFCRPHAEAVAHGELHIGGVVPAPRIKGEA